jgi:hypothetical protein
MRMLCLDESQLRIVHWLAMNILSLKKIYKLMLLQKTSIKKALK